MAILRKFLGQSDKQNMNVAKERISGGHTRLDASTSLAPGAPPTAPFSGTQSAVSSEDLRELAERIGQIESRLDDAADLAAATRAIGSEVLRLRQGDEERESQARALFEKVNALADELSTRLEHFDSRLSAIEDVPAGARDRIGQLYAEFRKTNELEVVVSMLRADIDRLRGGAS